MGWDATSAAFNTVQCNSDDRDVHAMNYYELEWNPIVIWKMGLVLLRHNGADSSFFLWLAETDDACLCVCHFGKVDVVKRQREIQHRVRDGQCHA